MIFREMVIADYPQVMTLWSATESMSLRDADSRENIGAYLSRNPGLSFVACQGSKIVGAVLTGTDGRRGYLQHLAVDQTLRGQGVGKQLVRCCVSALEQQGIAKTHLFVANENLCAQTFYERLGWYPRDEVRMYSFNASEHQNV
ncbi:Acetyltransferase YpeA [Vibrio aerogenes CECT 7868]|uniref:Acetyltransferase YpeA n=1 Tax=Vibrio aerogenes CECT 7868 TaxID=1216006 RepID=A0A1M6DKM3_9VIBR|nr:GNAT family N-acetyltransferase [Vibrio aerogenes]SHI73720.1 Acetyltransferase YpeA [Vibrio aerogenes CECT 7868]